MGPAPDVSAWKRDRGDPKPPLSVYRINHNPREEAIIRKLTLGIVGAAALAAGLLLMRQQKQSQPKEEIAEAESVSATLKLERMRELGL